MKIAWASNGAHVKTGYGKQTRLALPRIKGLGHEVFGISLYGSEGGVIEFEGIKWFPKSGDRYSEGAIKYHARQEKADVIITLYDSWVYDPRNWGTPWTPYLPVDSENLPGAILDRMRASLVPIVYSQHARQLTEGAGIEALYVPHMVDTEVFRPIDRKEARSHPELLVNGQPIPDDVFVFGMVADNKVNMYTPSRKSIPQHLEAFRAFHQKHPDSLLYIHTNYNPGDQGINLIEMVLGMGIPQNAVLFPDPISYSFGALDEEYMAHAYNAMDCLMAVSMGEGFGVPILEAQACGTPVITADWTATAELCFAGWKVAKEDSERWLNPLGGYWRLPRIEAILEQMEAAYTDRHYYGAMRGYARTMALGYACDHVASYYWRPALEAIERKLEEKRQSRNLLATALEVV